MGQEAGFGSQVPGIRREREVVEQAEGGSPDDGGGGGEDAGDGLDGPREGVLALPEPGQLGREGEAEGEERGTREWRPGLTLTVSG